MRQSNKDDKPEIKRLQDIKGHIGAYSKFQYDHDYFGENVSANPDQLSEEDGYTAKMQRRPKQMKAFQILDRALRTLSKKQRDAYKLTQRDGFTLAGAGLMLGGISPQAVKKNLAAAIRNISAYCKAHTEELEGA